MCNKRTLSGLSAAGRRESESAKPPSALKQVTSQPQSKLHALSNHARVATRPTAPTPNPARLRPPTLSPATRPAPLLSLRSSRAAPPAARGPLSLLALTTCLPSPQSVMDPLQEYQWIVVFGAIAAIFTAFVRRPRPRPPPPPSKRAKARPARPLAQGIGANDVANAYATSVGSKALTIKQACFLAVIFEFAGAVLAGSSVAETIRKGTADYKCYSQTYMDQAILMYGNLCVVGACPRRPPPRPAPPDAQPRPLPPPVEHARPVSRTAAPAGATPPPSPPRRRGRRLAPHRHQVRDARLDHPLLRRRPRRHGHRLQGPRLRHVVQGPRPGQR